MTRERLDKIERECDCFTNEWGELVALARVGLNSEDLARSNRTLREAIALHRAEIVALHRVAELAQEYRRVTKGEYPRAYNFADLDAALARVGMSVEPL